MTKREIHTYLYECDGYLTDGRKCIEERRVEAFSSHDADVAISEKNPYSVVDPWSFTPQGWLCTRAHRGEGEK